MKKCLAFTLSFIIAISTASFSVLADGDYINGFAPTESYTKGQFIDIGEEWYSDSVKSVYEVGLMKGDSINTFNPNGQLTNAEAVAVAARIHSIYNYGKDSFSTTSPWYQAYIDYAVSNNICDNNFNPNDTAQRAFFAGIIGKATDSIVLSEKNSIDNNSLPDVNGWYAESVYKMYRAGILCGNDKYGTFAPETSITRAEVAAILSRVIKPNERVNFVPETKPNAEYSLVDDDGSLNAFKQRAIMANLRVILNEEPKDEKWNSDTYVYTKTTSRNKVDRAYIPNTDIYAVYYSMLVTGNTHWENDGKQYFIALDTDGIVDYDSGSFDFGMRNAIIVQYEVITTTQSVTYTYDSFTAATQSLIDSAEFKTTIDANSVKEHIEKTYGDCQNEIYIGYLTDWDGQWYITMNKNNMYQPLPRDKGNSNQSEYVFTPTDNKTKEWCKNNFGKYVVAFVNPMLDKPLMLSEISGYADTKDKAVIKSWNYTNGVLELEWKPKNEVTFINPIVITDYQLQQELLDVSGLVPACKMHYERTASTSYENVYSIDYRDSYDNFSNRTFFMFVNGDNISLVKINNFINNRLSQGNEPKHQTIQLTVNSDKAIIDGLKLKYDFSDSDDIKDYGQHIDNYISTGNGLSASISPKPKKVNGIIYLPPEFIIKTLYKDNLNYEDIGVTDYRYDTDEDAEYPIIPGYAKVFNEVGTDWTYYLDGYEKTKFRLRKSSIIDGYDYGVSKSSNGPHIGFNIESEKACIQVWYNGTEYGEKIVTIPKPKIIYGSIYLPIEILDLLKSDGDDWSRHKI